jgi:NADH dehydrogenase
MTSRTASASERRHHVVVVGAGFGGLPATRFMRRMPVSVTLVDRTNHHLFQPLLYQVATGILSEGEIARATREVLRRQSNARVELAEVVGIDLEGRVVHARRPDGGSLELGYDSLVVAAGAQQSYFGHDEWRAFAPGMKTIDDALDLRGRILGAFEMAETTNDPDERAAWLTFAVVGGGPTGVEMAGQIAELARRTLPPDFRSIDAASARVLLFDGGREVLANFGDRLSGKATDELRRLGVELHTGTRVTGVDDEGITISTKDGGGGSVPCRTKVWAAGVQASPLAAMLAEASGAACDRAGRIEVLPDTTVPGYPEVFVIGDMMALNGLPGVSEVAIQQGIHAARAIHHRLEGTPSPPFRYRDLGSMATIGRFRAVASIGRLRLSGLPAWLVWLVVHLTFLTGFRSRFTTLLQWMFSFLGSGRGERTITARQVSSPGLRLERGTDEHS